MQQRKLTDKTRAAYERQLTALQAATLRRRTEREERHRSDLERLRAVVDQLDFKLSIRGVPEMRMSEAARDVEEANGAADEESDGEGESGREGEWEKGHAKEDCEGGGKQDSDVSGRETERRSESAVLFGSLDIADVAAQLEDTRKALEAALQGSMSSTFEGRGEGGAHAHAYGLQGGRSGSGSAEEAGGSDHPNARPSERLDASEDERVEREREEVSALQAEKEAKQAELAHMSEEAVRLIGAVREEEARQVGERERREGRLERLRQQAREEERRARACVEAPLFELVRQAVREGRCAAEHRGGRGEDQAPAHVRTDDRGSEQGCSAHGVGRCAHTSEGVGESQCSVLERQLCVADRALSQLLGPMRARRHHVRRQLRQLDRLADRLAGVAAGVREDMGGVRWEDDVTAGVERLVLRAVQVDGVIREELRVGEREVEEACAMVEGRGGGEAGRGGSGGGGQGRIGGGGGK